MALCAGSKTWLQWTLFTALQLTYISLNPNHWPLSSEKNASDLYIVNRGDSNVTSPGSGTFEREFPFALSRWSISTGQPFFFLLYLGELGGLRGREKGSEGYQRECLLN